MGPRLLLNELCVADGVEGGSSSCCVGSEGEETGSIGPRGDSGSSRSGGGGGEDKMRGFVDECD